MLKAQPIKVKKQEVQILPVTLTSRLAVLFLKERFQNGRIWPYVFLEMQRWKQPLSKTYADQYAGKHNMWKS